MTVLLVLATFLVFIVLDYCHESAAKRSHTVAVGRLKPSRSTFGGDYVGGFHVPENLSYHTGHSWLVRERKNVVRVGADEFAAALLGKIEKIEVPEARRMDPAGAESPLLLPRRRQDRNGLPHRRRSDGGQHAKC